MTDTSQTFYYVNLSRTRGTIHEEPCHIEHYLPENWMGKYASRGAAIDAVLATATGYTVPAPACGTTLELRVRAKGNSTDYLAAWSPYSDSTSYVMKTCPV